MIGRVAASIFALRVPCGMLAPALAWGVHSRQIYGRVAPQSVPSLHRARNLYGDGSDLRQAADIRVAATFELALRNADEAVFGPRMGASSLGDLSESLSFRRLVRGARESFGHDPALAFTHGPRGEPARPRNRTQGLVSVLGHAAYNSEFLSRPPALRPRKCGASRSCSARCELSVVLGWLVRAESNGSLSQKRVQRSMRPNLRARLFRGLDQGVTGPATKPPATHRTRGTTMLAAMSPIILDRPPSPRIWSAAARRRGLPARLAGTCGKSEPRSDNKALHAGYAADGVSPKASARSS